MSAKAKRDAVGRLLCRRPGCLEVRWSDRECEEHARMTYATWLDSVHRREAHSAPWRKGAS